MSFCQFLAQGWNATALAAIVGVLLALVIEYIPPYQELPAKAKQLLYMAACAVVGGVMWGLALWQQCPAVPDWWTMVQAIVAAWGIAVGTGSLFHRLIVAVGLGYKAK